MKVLVVYAHPNPNSFNHAVVESFTRGLKDGGHEYEVLDLYKVKFNPVMGLDDFTQFTDLKMPEDVQEHQRKVQWADEMVFVYPIWEWTCPAILEGWYQRVFSNGVAYNVEEGITKGLLNDKKAMIISSTMANEDFYKSSGIEDAIVKKEWATFTGVCGIEDLEHVFLYEATNKEKGEEYLRTVYTLAKDL